MKKVVLIAFILYSFLYSQETFLPEGSVAVVNGVAIFEDELEREVTKELPRAYFHSTVDDEKRKALREKALDNLIEKTLFYKYALTKGLKVDHKDVQNKMDKIIEAYGSKEALEKALKPLGYTYESFVSSLERDYILSELYKKEIEVNLSDDELREYYEKNLYKFKEPEKIQVSMIYVRNNPTDPKGKEKAEEKILKAKKELDDGENFAFVAQNYSNAPSRVKGGDLGFLHRGRLDETIEEEAFALDSNTTSDIIEKDVGFYIVRVGKKQEPKQLLFEDIKEGLKKELKTKREKENKEKILQKLKSTAVIIK